MKTNDHIIGSDAGTGGWYVDSPSNPFTTKPQAIWFAMSGTTVSESQAIKEIAVMTSQQQFIDAAKAANRKVWDGINELVELQKQWNALDYGATLVDATGGLTAAEIGAVVFDTADALVAVQGAGHATNQAKLL